MKYGGQKHTYTVDILVHCKHTYPQLHQYCITSTLLKTCLETVPVFSRIILIEFGPYLCHITYTKKCHLEWRN